MKKKIFLSAIELCLSLLLIISPVNAGLSDCVYAVSEEEQPDNIFPSHRVAEGVRQSGHWLYFDREDHISVCGYSGNEEHITIPSEIEGKQVTELSYGGTEPDASYSRNFFGDDGYLYGGESGSVMSPTKHVTIPDTVTKIGANTFYGCNLEQADLPECLTYIGSNAFSYCGCLKNVNIPSTVTIIDDMAFCTAALTSLTLPEGLEYIGHHAFSGSDITQLVIPDSVKYIGRSAFSFCWSLEEVTLSENLIIIPESLLGYCLKLKSVKIPEGVQIIEPYAFEGCSELETLYIPSTVSIMSEILRDNTVLKDIYLGIDSETAASIASTDLMSYLSVYKTDHSNVTIHYGEKEEAPQEDPLWDHPIRAVFLILGIAFFLTFIAALCLYIAQRIRLAPKLTSKTAAVNAPLGNALTGLAYSDFSAFSAFSDSIRCTKCGAESGKVADYCYNCGKKLNKK